MFKALLAFGPILCIVLGLLPCYGVLPAESEEEARTTLIGFSAIAAFLLLLYHVILPRRYQIIEDKIKIVLGGPVF